MNGPQKYGQLLDYLYDILGALSLPLLLAATPLLIIIIAAAIAGWWPAIAVITLLALLELALQKIRS
jgi:hypothetical protein